MFSAKALAALHVTTPTTRQTTMKSFFIGYPSFDNLTST
jgi:hypothetical protein